MYIKKGGVNPQLSSYILLYFIEVENDGDCVWMLFITSFQSSGIGNSTLIIDESWQFSFDFSIICVGGV